MRIHGSTAGCILAALAIGLAWGCSADVTLIPAGTETPGDSVGAVQRVQLEITAVLSGSDSLIGALIGSPGGVLAGAEVRIRRGGATPQTARTDTDGRVQFANLLPGTYAVSVLRLLDSAEQSGLDSAHADVNAFGGAAIVDASAPLTALVVPVSAARRGALVLSEVFPARWLGPPEYPFGNYLELYNNADTMLYLDGKLLGDGPFWFFDQSGGARGDFPCDSTQQWQADAAGIWATWLSRFPGTGREYPLAPGTTALVVTDAVDHRVVDPRWPDLSNASFELVGTNDADNAAVPNMIVVHAEFSDLRGHGQTFDATLGRSWFVADGIDLGSVPRLEPGGNYRTALPRIPAEEVLDVFTSTAPLASLAAIGTELCPLMISPTLDAQPGRFFDAGGFYSVQRVPLGTLDDGRPLLLRTKATAADFRVVGAPTPGRAP